MKGFFYLLLTLLIIAGVGIITCPDKNAHSDALKDLLNTALTEELSTDLETTEDAAWAAFGSVLGTGLGGWIIDNMLTVENYFICSVGYITFDGETEIVSLGLLNHVFTANDEEIMEAASEIF